MATTQDEERHDRGAIGRLPHELVRYILVAFTDRQDRIVASCVCRGWRRQLWIGRRYCWRHANGSDRAWPLSMACAAIERGHPRVALWLLDNMPTVATPPWTTLDPLCRASLVGDADTVRSLRARGRRWEPRTACAAIVNNRTENLYETMRQIEEDGCLSAQLVQAALAYVGALDQLRRLVDQERCNYDGPEIAFYASTAGRCDVLAWLATRPDGAKWIMDAIIKDVSVVALGTIVWATEHALFVPTDNAVAKFARYGRLDVIEWICARTGSAVSSRALYKAVRGGNVALITWLLDKGVGPDVDRNLQCCRWIITDRDATDSAIVGLVERLYDLHMICLWRADCDHAVARGHLATLQWLLPRAPPGYLMETPGKEADTRLWRECLGGAHAHVVEWMLPVFGLPPPDAITRALTSRAPWPPRLCCARLLSENGCAWTAADCRRLAEGGHLDLLRDAIVHRGAPWSSRECMTAALCGDSPEHRATAAWIGDFVGVDVGAFERDLLDA